MNLRNPSKVKRAGAALVDDRGDSAADADEIGVEPEIARDVLVDMGVGIDQPRSDDQPASVNDLGLGTGFEPRRESCDAAFPDADVADAVDIVGRVDDMPPGQHQVVDRLQPGDRPAGRRACLA